MFGEPWFGVAERQRDARRREAFLSLFGPLSLILLLATWAAGLILGFGLIQWETGARAMPAEETANFWTALYFSGSSFFTLGLGDIAPRTGLGRTAGVVEAGTGFVLLALVVGYLPVLYQAFSRREVEISMLDEWAGSPPSAGELLRRLGGWGDAVAIAELAACTRGAGQLAEIKMGMNVIFVSFDDGREDILPAEDLTAREHQVLQLLAEGLSNKAIAYRLQISEHTAKFHVAAILAKLEAHSRTEAVTKAVRQGLIIL